MLRKRFCRFLRKISLRRKNKKWAEDEDQIILANYATLGKDTQTLIPYKTISQIQQRASTLGVRYSANLPKKVRCVETNEIFNSMSAADAKYNCKLIKCLKYGRKTAGGYHREYVD